MQGLLLSLLAFAAATPGHSVSPAIPSASASTSAKMPVSVEWAFNGEVDTSCSLQSIGEATGMDGASIDLDCSAGVQVMGNLQARIAAQGWRQRRVTISAEISTTPAMNASLWLKTQHLARTLMYDDATEQDLVGAATEDGWQRRTLTLPVAADATHVSFGVRLQGTERVVLRNIHVTVSEPGMIAPTAARLLESAISIVKQQTQTRDDLSWNVLEPQLRLFASGAQSTEEVYPAIKYLLSRLGDRQSLLLTPDVAAALRQFGSGSEASNAVVNIFALPDGACLVLSRPMPAGGLRTAQNRAANLDSALP